MAVTRVFDWLFINQLFRTDERGVTIFYPNGLMGRGYLVPPEREPRLRFSLRLLTLSALFGATVVTVLVPRLLESWWGITLPLRWFIGGIGVALVIGVGAIIHLLSRLTAGLELAPPRS